MAATSALPANFGSTPGAGNLLQPTDPNKPSTPTPYQKKQAGKAKVIKSAYNLADVTAQGVGALEQAGLAKQAAAKQAMQGHQQAYDTFGAGIEGGRGAIRGQAAEALAAGQAQSGGQGTAGGYGAALQAGKSAGLALGGYESDTAAKQAQMKQVMADVGYGYAQDAFSTQQQIGQAKQTAAGQLLEAERFEYDAPTEFEESDPVAQSAVATARQYVTDTFKGTFNDDEDAAYAYVYGEALKQENPAAKAALLQLASQIQSGQWDF